MDILDIDEALKDDSFIFLEDKTHDDISNILQQWKSNSCLPTSITTTIQHPQQHQEQVNKLDSRTFTRPKRKSALSLESQFTNIAHQQQNGTVPCESPMLNVEIGGLVTTMEKSFLQDTSPPSFLHSMDNSINVMNNSLITSADFTNISFLQSTNSLQDVGQQQHHIPVTGGGYTLNDMLRDRKTLESLTMSSDGTLIKDSHIGQIDDISLTLSKTASSCSTMENSTESEGGANRTVVMFNQNYTFNNGEERSGIQLELAGAAAGAGDNIANNKTGRAMASTDEIIGDITYNLVENSMCASTAKDATHPIIDNSCHELVNKTVTSIPQDGGLEGNTTFDYQQNVTPDKCCETPEAVERNGTRAKFCVSTPQASSLRYNKQPYTSRLNAIEDTNISPITALSPHTPQQQLNKTYEQHYQAKNSTYISSSNTSLETFPHQPVEIKENSSEGFNQTYQQHYNTQTLGMQNVMHLAEAEANLLAANNNEEEFDHMLDEFGRIELNSEQLKMKKSLDSLKKRFNYNSNSSAVGGGRPTSQPLDEDDVMMVKDNHNREEFRDSKERLNELSPASANEQILHKEQDSPCCSNSMDSKSPAVLLNGSTGLSLSAGSSGCGGERLLSRRSRLYDDINLSTISSTPASHNLRSSTSFIIKKDNASNNMGLAAVAANTAKCETECSNVNPLETESDVNTDENICAPIQQKLMGKLLHDRDRFKTITISKNRATKPRSEDVITNEFNVPCVDDCNVMESATNAAAKTPDALIHQCDLTEKSPHDRDRFKTITLNNKRCTESKLKVPCIDNGNSDEPLASDSYETPLTGRCSRRDQTYNTQFDAKSDTETPTIPKTNANTNTNYLTYKKPKDTQTNVRNKEDTNTPTTIITPVKGSKARPESRTLSRPRYINGLTKLSAVNKTASAGELEKALPNARNDRHFNTKESSSIGKSGGDSIDLKSPMGTKSKSFQNLSTNLTLHSGIGAPAQQLACKTFGLHKPNSYGSGLVKPSALRNSMLSATQQQKNDDSVFKVPKQVSGIRAPGGAAPLTTKGTSIGKRAGLVRPSSGYYSLNVMAKGKQFQHTASDPESDSGRHSPTDSMSSASSKGSAQSLNKTFGLKPSLTSKLATTKANDVATNLNLQKVTIGSTGIPKPSGLRPPSNIKRSGLPRPASFIKTDK